MMQWTVFDTGKASAVENMAIDQLLLQSLATAKGPMLHFYDWLGHSATYGHFINPSDFLNVEALETLRVDLARRPTGGGILFHVADFAFSLLIPASYGGYSQNTLENYAFVNRIVIEAISGFTGNHLKMSLLPEESVAKDAFSKHFCMAKPTIFDVVVEGRKVGGGAQRRTKHGYLHQGTIALAMADEEFLSAILKPGTCVLESMRAHSYLLLDAGHSQEQLVEARMELQKNLIGVCAKIELGCVSHGCGVSS